MELDKDLSFLLGRYEGLELDKELNFNFSETNAWNGIRNYYTDLGRALESYSEDEPKVAAPLKQQNRKLNKTWCIGLNNYMVKFFLIMSPNAIYAM